MTVSEHLHTLEIRNLTVRKGGVEILSGIDADLRCGEVTALVGPNGAGKTTLLLAILGQVPYTGKIRFCRAVEHGQGAPRIGYVPQREGEENPLELPAGEPAQGALEEVGDAGPLEALPGGLPGAAGGAEEDGAALGGEREEVEHRDRHVRVEGKALRHVPDAGGPLAVLRRAAETDLSRVRHLAQDREEQGGLSRAVGADQGGDLSAPEVGVDPRKDLHPSLPDGQVADLERVAMFAPRHRADSASFSVERFRRIASS